MANKTFHLPDLGEGLPDAEIVQWHVQVGERAELDQPLVSMETAKAVVEVPSPFTGTVLKLYGAAGDVIETGAPLAEFELDPNAAQRAEAEPTGHHHAPKKSDAPPAAPVGAAAAASAKASAVEAPASSTARVSAVGAASAATAKGPAVAAEAAPTGAGARADSGTVVGAMEASDRVAGDALTHVGGVRALPAVRALARKLGVDLAQVVATGADGVVTMQDVKQAAANGTAKLPSPAGRGGETGNADALRRPVERPREQRGQDGGEGTGHAQRNAPPEPSPAARRAAPSPGGREEGGESAGRFDSDPRSAAGKPIRTVPPTVEAQGQPEPIRGVRRNMARVMAEAHAQVVPTTLCDDADLHAWTPGNDITVRLVRAIVAGARAVPALNAWFDAAAGTRTLHRRVDIGIAVDTDDGLFVPALRNADVLDAGGVRAAVNRIRDQVRDRSIPAEELKGYTISLSNFGVFAGRYATPIVVPPCVAIVAAGKLRHELVPVMGGVETHRLLPLSLTFDHRAATGGEAARFLRAMLDDLARPG